MLTGRRVTIATACRMHPGTHPPGPIPVLFHPWLVLKNQPMIPFPQSFLPSWRRRDGWRLRINGTRTTRPCRRRPMVHPNARGKSTWPTTGLTNFLGGRKTVGMAINLLHRHLLPRGPRTRHCWMNSGNTAPMCDPIYCQPCGAPCPVAKPSSPRRTRTTIRPWLPSSWKTWCESGAVRCWAKSIAEYCLPWSKRTTKNVPAAYVPTLDECTVFLPTFCATNTYHARPCPALLRKKFRDDSYPFVE